jgi:hypothetical protein
VQDTGVVTKIKFPSDHRAVQMKLKVPRRVKIKNASRCKKQVVFCNAGSIQNLAELKQALRDNVKDLDKIRSVQERYDKLEATLIELGEEVSKCSDGNRFGNRNDKLTQETKKLIELRNKLCGKENKTPRERIELIELRKTVRKAIRKDLTKYNHNLVKEYTENAWSIKKMRKQLYPDQNLMSGLKDSKGKLVKERKEIVKVATEYYTKLYSRTPSKIISPKLVKQSETDVQENEIESTEIEDEEEEQENFPPILNREIEVAISDLKKERAPGPDKITNDLIKIFAQELIPVLVDLFNWMVEKEQIPEQWKIVEIILLHKKGDRESIGNYRPISLNAGLYKMFSKIIKNRCYQQLDQNQGREQAGFRKGYSTTDHLFVINQLIEKCNEYNIEINLLLVDFYKAFDSVDLQYLWSALKRQGINSKMIRIIKEMYRNARGYVKLDKKGPEFNLEKGVKQGDPLAPNLFNCSLEEVFRNLGWEEKGIKINGEWLNNLRFADDTVLIAQSREDLQAMLDEFEEKSREAGLEINVEKTVLLSNSKETKKIYVKGKEVKTVAEATYLGQQISFGDRMDKEISSRMSKGWRNYWSLKQIYKSKIPIKAKVKILKSCTFPAMTYGAQTWALTNAQLEKLRRTQLAMERSIIDVKRRDRVRNALVRKKTGATDIRYLIKKMKYRYAGHISRKEGNRWEKILLDWTPYGNKRNRGRPRLRWEDEIRKHLGGLWQRDTKNRKSWERIGEAYAQRWANYKL